MKQIKVDELPKDWLVLDHHVESGSVDFIKPDDKIICEVCGQKYSEHYNGNSYAGNNGKFPNFPGQKWCVRGLRYDGVLELWGTKQIQLVGANLEIITESGMESEDGYNFIAYFMEERLEGYPELAYKALKIQAKGKDFFIYKVTEEK